MGSEFAVQTNDLSKVYRVGGQPVVALNRVSLQIRRGTFTAVVGTSGSGKSTLLNMLGGLERPSHGEVMVAGQRLDTMREAELVRFRRENVGFIFQSFNLIASQTAVDNVAMPLTFRGWAPRQRRERAERVLTQWGLGRHLHHKPDQLSGGQQQRVGIARALVAQPAIVFADEPTGNLDSKTAEQTLTLFRTVVQRFGQTWIMVTHDQHLAGFADTIVSIGDGRITDIAQVNHSDSDHTDHVAQKVGS